MIPLIIFGSHSINNLGEVVFIAGLEGSQGDGIFIGPDPVANKVIFYGDSLHGNPVLTIGLSQDSLNDKGQIAFLAFFQDGASGVFRADPSLEGLTGSKDSFIHSYRKKP